MSDILEVKARFKETRSNYGRQQVIGDSIDFAIKSLESRVMSLFYTFRGDSLFIQLLRKNKRPFGSIDKSTLEDKMKSYGAFDILSVSLY